MKHVFVVNPNAGQKDSSPKILETLKAEGKGFDYEVYKTTGRHDATRFIKEYLKKRPEGEITRFYAAGGDGTLYDIVNGVAEEPRCEVACLAYGSGNDFVKNFRCDVSNFRDINKAIKGKAIPIDFFKVNDRYCINITNYGFDGEVTERQIRFRRLPGVNGPMAYRLAALHSLLFKMNQPLKVTIDGEVVLDERKALLAIAGNGYCYGGGMYCAPYAKLTDGLLDFVLIKKVGRLKAAGFMKIFREGKHIEHPKTKDITIYRRGKKAVFESLHPVAYAIDGEVFREKRIEIEILPKDILFVLPEGVSIPK